MKKILIAARDLNIGGIEKSLIILVDYLIEHGYIVSLVLEKIEGDLLKNLNSSVKVIKYMPCSIKFRIIRKTINFFKRIKFCFKYSKKYDVAISYATYSKVSSYVARCASENSILWCHANYMDVFKQNKKLFKKFFQELSYNNFSKIVFVSKSAQKCFLEVFPEKKNTYFCNNIVRDKEIIEKSNEQIELHLEDNNITFLNVGRHDEKQKKITRIIEATKMLKKEDYKFKVLFVGNGKDTEKYKDMVQKNNLDNTIVFVGAKENPYPYYKIADAVVLSSDYEGYPVVFLESYILNKPIITTEVSDYEDIKEKRGIVVEKSVQGIYKGMKEFLKNGYKIKKTFDFQAYNLSCIEKLNEILQKF